MPDKTRAAALLKLLKKSYPKADCALHHAGAFQLLIATILSAQCTDERVNQVTPVLFQKFPTPQAMARAPLPQVEELIRPTGFFRQKAKSLVMAARAIVENFHGQVPRTLPELLTLRGVARKTANVVLGTAYHIAEGIVVDTHVRRLSNRMGLTRHKEPGKIERDLMKLIPRPDWIWFSHSLITHGRRHCKALKPLCEECELKKVCPRIGLN